MLSIIVPVRNESDNLKDILSYYAQGLSDINYEVLIINDFSEDNTFNKAQSLFEKNENFKVFNNLKKGLGGAINLGIKKSSGVNIAIMMADQSDDINDLIKYLQKFNFKFIITNRSKTVLGGKNNRFLDKSLYYKNTEGAETSLLASYEENLEEKKFIETYNLEGHDFIQKNYFKTTFFKILNRLNI